MSGTVTAPGAIRAGGTLGSRSAGDPRQGVRQLRQCLDELGPTERQVLTLRAGLGPGAPLTRSQVARRLDLAIAQTGRIERRGLRRLDRIAGAGACGGAVGGADAMGATAVHGDTTAIPAGGAATGLHPRYGVGGVMAHGGEASDDDSGGRSGLGLPPPLGTGGEATLFVGLGLFVALALLLRRELLRR
jgi:hypothetical protein